MVLISSTDGPKFLALAKRNEHEFQTFFHLNPTQMNTAERTHTISNKCHKQNIEDRTRTSEISKPRYGSHKPQKTQTPREKLDMIAKNCHINNLMKQMRETGNEKRKKEYRHQGVDIFTSVFKRSTIYSTTPPSTFVGISTRS